MLPVKIMLFVQNFLKRCMNVSLLFSRCHIQVFATPWTVARQAPPSMGFPRQEYWSGLPFASPGDLPNPGIKPVSPALAHRHTHTYILLFQYLVVLIVPVSWFLTPYSSKSNRGPLKKNLFQRQRQEM